MGRIRINIDSGAKIQKFVDTLEQNNIDGVLESTHNGIEYRVNARSLLGALATLDWPDGVWIKTDSDIQELIKDFIVK